MKETENVIHVGIAEGAIAEGPRRLRSTGLGSCVGVVIYSPQRETAGLVHIMLPEAPGDGTKEAYKYANTGIQSLLDTLRLTLGADTLLTAKIAGGSEMFANRQKKDSLRIGPRNVEAVRQELAAQGIPIAGEDVGGTVGRTIEFSPEDRILRIRTAFGSERTL